jgi:hypothetical protein
VSEQVEWRVGYFEGDQFHSAQDGAQSVFGLTNAQKLAKKLGAPYQLFHWRTNLSPAEHEAAQARENDPPWGGRWAP